MLEQQSWHQGVFEARWSGRDFRHGGAEVSIYEVTVPDAHSLAARTMLRTSAYALLSAGRHPSMPTLQDVFNDQERAFFVFEPLQGESLQARLRHLGHPLSEQEAITLCVQMTELLELLASQSPPLVHGRIHPEHIYPSYDGFQCSLGGLSPIIASGVRQFIMEALRTQNLPYTAPEFSQGMVDGRSDLYSLVATAYYAVTGMVPAASGGVIPHAQHFNAALSSDFDAVLAKGLHSMPQQRYQYAAELRQDLLAIRSRAVSGNLVTRGNVNEPMHPFPARENTFRPNAPAPRPAYPFPIMPNIAEKEEEGDEERVLLPSPEMLPPISEGNDRLEAALVLTAVVLGMSVLTILSNFHG